MNPAEPLTRTIYHKGKGVVTEPMVVKPAQMTRREWREHVRKGKRLVKQNAKAEARKPESVKLDERLHAAGLISPRDVAAVRPVHFDTQIVSPLRPRPGA